MKPRKIKQNIYYVGASDPKRRLFDALIPLPDGTSYNAYLIKGSQKTALLDTVDPAKLKILLSYLKGINKIDYVISHHAEQDHSGSIGEILKRYPEAIVITSEKGKEFLLDLLHLPPEKISVIKDGETLSLGDKNIKFIATTWSHWPETISSYLIEDKILFSCDLFGSHLPTEKLYEKNEDLLYKAAKRYYAELMMPFRSIISKHIINLKKYEIKLICTSHGPLYDKPNFIISAYDKWMNGPLEKKIVIPYVSMHDSTRVMVEHLKNKLEEKKYKVIIHDLVETDMGQLAMDLVEAEGCIIGAPTVLSGAHPLGLNAAYLLNIIKPRINYWGIVGSYGWGGRTADQIKSLVQGITTKWLTPVIIKGLPRKNDLTKLDQLVKEIS